MLAETINAIEIQAIEYAVNVAENCNNLNDFIEIMRERQLELIKGGSKW